MTGLRLHWKSHTLHISYIISGILCLIGMVYLFSPLYQYICTTDYPILNILSKNIMEHGYEYVLNVHIETVVSDDLPLKISIKHPTLKVYLDQLNLGSIQVHNYGKSCVTALSIVDIIPEEFKNYFHKQQCFCFEPLRIYPGEDVYLPLLFHITKEFQHDSLISRCKELTVLYTFIRIGW